MRKYIRENIVKVNFGSSSDLFRLHLLFTKKKKKSTKLEFIHRILSIRQAACAIVSILAGNNALCVRDLSVLHLGTFRVISLATSVYMCACIFMSMISTKKERERRKKIGQRNTYNSCSNVIQENNVAKYFCETKKKNVNVNICSRESLVLNCNCNLFPDKITLK